MSTEHTGNIAPDLHPLLKPITSLKGLEGNPRKGDIAAVARSYNTFGQRKPIVAREDGTVIAGNHQLKAALSLGWSHLAVVTVTDDDATAKAFALADNRTAELGTYDDHLLAELIKEVQEADLALLAATGWDPIATEEDGEESEPAPSLADKFLIPPFSVLDARSGEWQTRKKQWLNLGIRSEEGREGGLVFNSAASADPTYMEQKRKWEKTLGRTLEPQEFERDYHRPTTGSLATNGTSVFDPVLCEVAYRWFSAPGQHILDPFAGGSVRGAVAAALGRRYTGIDLRDEQIQANRAQWPALRKRVAPRQPDRKIEDAAAAFGVDVAAKDDDRPTTASDGTAIHDPKWIAGDSNVRLDELPDGQLYDLVFSCPPYADLEVYSKDPADISNMEYDEFVAVYRSIIAKSVARLKPNAFAVWVIGEVRGKGGLYRGFVPDTIRAFEDAGARFYNEAILVTQVGSNAMRAGRQFTNSRKLGKTHQNVLVFFKEDEQPTVATRALEPAHQTVLVFTKGDPVQATKDAGTVTVRDALDQLLIETTLAETVDPKERT